MKRALLLALVLLTPATPAWAQPAIPASPTADRAAEPAASPSTPQPAAPTSDTSAPPAAPTSDTSAPPAAPPASGLLPLAGALVPGVLVHGTGLWLAGDPATAQDLLLIQGSGLATLLVGFIPLALSGASSHLIGTTYTLTLTGLGLFLLPWAADLYGASVGGRPDAVGWNPQHRLEVGLGYGHVHDPRFAFRHFAILDATLRLNRVRLTPCWWRGLDDDHWLARLEGGWRLWGSRPDQPATQDGSTRDASFLEPWLGATYHHYGRDGFSFLTVELFVPGRLDLARLSPSLAGSFAELGLGWGYQFFHYDVPGLEFGEDASELLLMRFGFGVYWGQPPGLQGELSLFYDHRRDDFAAGLATGSISDGIPGHVGVAGQLFHRTGWGVRGELLAGSAYVAYLSVVRGFGGHTP